VPSQFPKLEEVEKFQMRVMPKVYRAYFSGNEKSFNIDACTTLWVYESHGAPSKLNCELFICK
jgi:hypothetical protein